MPIEFLPIDESLLPLTRAFNIRLKEGGAPVDFFLPESEGRPPCLTGQIRRRHIVARDGDFVRGGYLETTYPGSVGGTSAPLVNISAILSESLIDKRFVTLPSRMLKEVRRDGRYVFAVGAGGVDRPWPRFLKAADWAVEEVPFHFRFYNARRALVELRPLREPRWRGVAARLAAASGLGPAAIHTIQALRSRRMRTLEQQQLTTVTNWGPWADELWSSVSPGICIAVARRSEVLREMYDLADPRIRVWRLCENARTVAWTASLLTTYTNHKYFGNLRTAVLLDAIALPGAAASVLRLTSSALARDGAELVVCNFSHGTWIRACSDAGFWRGPSNFMLAVPPDLASVCGQPPVRSGQAHFTRGDADGRVNL